MLVALALLTRDPLEVLALFTEGEDLVVGVPGLLLEDVLVDLAQDSPLGGIGLNRGRVLRVRLETVCSKLVSRSIAQPVLLREPSSRACCSVRWPLIQETLWTL